MSDHHFHHHSAPPPDFGDFSGGSDRFAGRARVTLKIPRPRSLVGRAAFAALTVVLVGAWLFVGLVAIGLGFLLLHVRAAAGS